MINAVRFCNFGPLRDLTWAELGPINLIIGANDTGKTFLLKALYCVTRTLEEYQRGDDPRSAAEILAEKLYWTYQATRIGDLVSKGAAGPLDCSVDFDRRSFSFSFGKDTSSQISALENHVQHRTSNSIFLPAKELLSLHKVILKSRDTDKAFGFDDTYLDLARALGQPPTRGRNYSQFAKARIHLGQLLGGKIVHDGSSDQWYFSKERHKFPIGVTAEGVRKIAILDTLLGNRYLSQTSIVFIDEPEAALHPAAIGKLLDIIAILASAGIQFFLASHSYFVIKKLFLIAQQQHMSIPVLAAEDGKWVKSNLKDGLPPNAIIKESIRLYSEEVDLVLR